MKTLLFAAFVLIVVGLLIGVTVAVRRRGAGWKVLAAVLLVGATLAGILAVVSVMAM